MNPGRMLIWTFIVGCIWLAACGAEQQGDEVAAEPEAPRQEDAARAGAPEFVLADPQLVPVPAPGASAGVDKPPLSVLEKKESGPEPSDPPEPVIIEGSMSPEKEKLQSYYEPVEYEAGAAIEPYDLPLAPDQVVNFDQVVNSLGLGDQADKLLANGFVVVPYGDEEDMVEVYRMLKESPVPSFVTVDTWLHLYHVQFDELLMTLEETLFYGDILEITDLLLENAVGLYEVSEGNLKEAARRNVAFLRVARELLTIADLPETAPDTPVPEYVAKEVQEELALIEKHEGFTYSPLFVYKEDYSQYVPRGHYTRSELLKSYFRALMWYGRLTMLLKGGEPACEYDTCPALIKPWDADIQTLQALLLTLDMNTLESDAGRIADQWERIYLVTSYFVGLADDLTPYEYLDTMVEVLGEQPSAAGFDDPDVLFAVRASLAQKKAPQIYGGTGGQVIIVSPGEPVTPDMLDLLLEKSKGFRFMGQRFIPDSYIMGRLVSPGAGQLGPGCDGGAFTAVATPAGTMRGFPRGLDVMAALGSERARQWLADLKDDCYTKYNESFDEMKGFLDDQTEAQWHANLYWGWLFALQALLQDAPEGTQTFMQTQAYTDKSMNAALSSWAELRHDTILYAKQSYTPDCDTDSVGPPPPPPGYVEPNAEFYARLLALNEMTLAGLEDMGVLPDEAKLRLEALSQLLARMLDITLVELKGEPLSQEDIWLIAGLADNLDKVVAGVEDAGVKTTMVADVHTDQNSKQVLEEGVGYVQLLIAAYRLPDGTISLGAGPVLSYYEFKHPMADRLTDEAWREILQEGDVPAAPPWTTSYLAE